MTPQTTKLLASTKNKITKDENGENVPHLEITEVSPLQHWKQRLSTRFKSILLDLAHQNLILLKAFNSEFFFYIRVCFADQNSMPLKIEDKANITVVINLKCKI